MARKHDVLVLLQSSLGTQMGFPCLLGFVPAIVADGGAQASCIF